MTKPKKAVFKVTVDVPDGMTVSDLRKEIKYALDDLALYYPGIAKNFKVTRYRPSRNERTSPRVAKIAGRVLSADAIAPTKMRMKDATHVSLTGDDIRAMAGSLVTQSPDRKPKPKKRTRKAKGKR